MHIDTSPRCVILVATSSGKQVLRGVNKLIHRSAQKGDSPKFVFTAFSEIGRLLRVMEHILRWSTYTRQGQEYAAFVMWPADVA